MYEKLSPKQLVLYSWFHIEEFNDCEICLATGAIRTGKTEIGSTGWFEDAMMLVADTPTAYRTKGFNLFTIISTSKSLALLNIIEPIVISLEVDGYKESKTIRQFYKSSGGTFVHTTSPMGLLQIKDTEGNITRFLYLGADNKKVLNRVTGLTMRGWFLDEVARLGGVEEDNIKFIEVMLERTATFRVKPYGRPLQMMTTNPQTDDEGMFYQRFIKGGFDKGILVISFEFLDNPQFTKEDEDYYRKLYTKAQFLRKIKGRWVKDNELSTYPKFDKVKCVKTREEIMSRKFNELAIGLDEGQSDARGIVLTGFDKVKTMDRISKVKEWYYKNTPEKPVMAIDDYANKIWDKAIEWYALFDMPIKLFYDSANLSLGVLIKKYKRQRNITIPVVVKPVNKASVYGAKGEGSAIRERWEFINIMLGAGLYDFSEDCPVLIRAINRSTNKDGARIDDGHTNNVDIQDASEYSEKHRLRRIQNKVEQRNTNEVKEHVRVVGKRSINTI